MDVGAVMVSWKRSGDYIERLEKGQKQYFLNMLNCISSVLLSVFSTTCPWLQYFCKITLRGLGRMRRGFFGAFDFLDVSESSWKSNLNLGWKTFFCFLLLAESATLLLLRRSFFLLLGWSLVSTRSENLGFWQKKENKNFALLHLICFSFLLVC